MRVYIAGPLFNEMERVRNREMRDFVRNLGFETYLPQEDAGVADLLIKDGADSAQTRKSIFDRDIEEVRACDILLCLLDGKAPDEGVCIELGFAHALGKTCIGYSTEQRTFDMHGRNLMIDGCLQTTLSTKESLRSELIKYK